MKALTYVWSGDSKTIIDIGDNYPLVTSALSAAIDRFKDDFRELVHEVYVEKKLKILGPYEIKSKKADIRKLKKLKEILDHTSENYVTSQEAAKAELSKWL